MTETVKIKITPNTVSGSTEDQQDVAKLSFANNGIKSSLPHFVNEKKVITENQFLQYDEQQGIMRAEKVFVQKEFLVNGQEAVFQSDDFKVENGSVQAKDLRVNGNKVLATNQYLSFNETTGIINSNGVHANELKVKGIVLLVSSPDLLFDPATGTLTVKRIKILETIEVA